MMACATRGGPSGCMGCKRARVHRAAETLAALRAEDAIQACHCAIPPLRAPKLCRSLAYLCATCHRVAVTSALPAACWTSDLGFARDIAPESRQPSHLAAAHELNMASQTTH